MGQYPELCNDLSIKMSHLRERTAADIINNNYCVEWQAVEMKMSRRVHHGKKHAWPSKKQRATCRLSPWLQEYFSKSTVHGLHYIVEGNRHWSERLLWTICCSLALSAASYTSWEVWNRFQKSPTVTMLETTNFPIAQIPFPAVTICNNNRVYWNKAMEYETRYLNNSANQTLDAFRDFLHAMSTIDFGDFDKMYTYFGSSLERADMLSEVDMTHLMVQVAPSCSEIFVNTCWWRNMELDCCSIFELQKTEYGFCYSFNSETSETAGHRVDKPRRTGAAGVWSGLRVVVDCAPQFIPPHRDFIPGIIVIVHHPHDFPMTGNMVTAGSTAEVSVTAQLTEPSPAVRDISLHARHCLYHDETVTYYSRKNCITECHMNSTLQHCLCVPYFFPSWSNNAPVCNVRGFLCLAEFNYVFNYEKPAVDFDDMEGMICDCMEDCVQLTYSAQLYTAQQYRCSTQVLLDVHFRDTGMMKYRMDVVYDWLSLTVSLGGIVGLFLGCSLLSTVEVLYYFTFRLYVHTR